MKPKLLITTDCFLPRWDGVARFLKEVIPRLARTFEVTVIAPDFAGDFDPLPDITVIRIPLLKVRFGDIYFSRFQYGQIKRLVEESDIVFNQTIGPIGLCAILAASKLSKPVISYVHSIEWELASKGVKYLNSLVYWVVRKINRWLYNKCDLLLVPSREVEDLISLNGVRTKKMVVELGVDTSRFEPPLVKSRAKKAIGLSGRDVVIGFVGRISREKDLQTLIRAFRKLRRKHKGVTLLIVGAGLTEELLKSSKTVYVGKRDDVVPFLQAMDVFVMPSLTETSSLATMEAMASGLAVVSTPVGSIKKYITDGEQGLLFPRQDHVALYEKLARLVEDRTLRARLGREARKSIIMKKNLEDVASLLTHVFLRSLGR